MLFDCLQNAPQPTLDGIRKITLGLISRLYNYTAVNPFGYANYSQSARRGYVQNVKRSLSSFPVPCCSLL